MAPVTKLFTSSNKRVRIVCFYPNKCSIATEDIGSDSPRVITDYTNSLFEECNQDYFHEKFDLGVCLHACGVATDMVLKQCIENNAQFVICPCCYGGIQETHFITYPRSQHFRNAGIEYKEYLTLGHVADQTEFNMALEEQGKFCMNLVDMDRSHYAREHGYTTSLCSLIPLSCTPKNNLIIGRKESVS